MKYHIFDRMKLLVAIVMFALAGKGLAAESAGTVSVAVGKVTIIPMGGSVEAELKVGDAVPVGSTVKTGAASRAVIKTTK